jgi:hypothetical protein
MLTILHVGGGGVKNPDWSLSRGGRTEAGGSEGLASRRQFRGFGVLGWNQNKARVGKVRVRRIPVAGT